MLQDRECRERQSRGINLKKRIAILISGRGSNMLALSDAIRDGRIPDAEIAIVISDKAGARGLELARERGIETLAIERRGRNREEHEREIIAALRTVTSILFASRDTCGCCRRVLLRRSGGGYSTFIRVCCLPFPASMRSGRRSSMG